MARKRSRKAIISRIKYYNRQVDKGFRVSTKKSLTIGELRQAERDIKARTYLNRTEFEIKSTNVTTRQLNKIKQLSDAYRRQDTDAFQKATRSLFKTSEEKLKKVEEGFKGAKEVSSIEYNLEVLKSIPQDLVEVELLLKAITEPTFVGETLLKELDKLNQNESIQNMGGVDFDSLDTLDKKQRQFLKNIQESPDILETIGKDDFEIVE